MKYNRLLSGILIFTCIFGCFWIFLGEELYDRTRFSHRICNNLVASNQLSQSQCFISTDVSDVMIAVFPLGTDINTVEQGMRGFDKVFEASGHSESCGNWERREYLIVHRWFILFDETYEFIFCDGKLNRMVWHN